ncbi:MAG: hypothetical protein WA755_00690 [Candidatus Acidiferrales bacterium]
MTGTRFRLALVLIVLFALAPAGARVWGQQAASPPTAPVAGTQGAVHGGPEFIHAADEVLAQMSALLSLPIKEPLKKTLRSKQEIRDYLIREDAEDKNADQKYADRKALEAFGLIPKDFPLDSFMLDVLTDQVAGLYDPKAKEFYIADWIPADEQRSVMAHELTHALVDQSFHLDEWIKAARPNDDAELARDSVSEGTAVAAMIDYSLADQKMSVRDLPDVTAIIRASSVSEMEKDPLLSKAPAVIRDELLFPYLDGTTFAQQFLKANTGWKDLHKLFENPPVSTQQIIHPELYLKGVKPETVTLPKWSGLVPAEWKMLEENVLGEFALREVLKQFVGEESAQRVAPYWTGDRYAVFEDTKTKRTELIVRVHLDSSDDAARFFGQYSDALELKYKKRTDLVRRPNYFQFKSDSGGVFLRCLASDCVSLEGADREMFDKLSRAIGWPAAPGELEAPAKSTVTVRIAPGSVTAVNRASL